jgi:hypothetical protein
MSKKCPVLWGGGGRRAERGERYKYPASILLLLFR